METERYKEHKEELNKILDYLVNNKEFSKVVEAQNEEGRIAFKKMVENPYKATYLPKSLEFYLVPGKIPPHQHIFSDLITSVWYAHAFMWPSESVNLCNRNDIQEVIQDLLDRYK